MLNVGTYYNWFFLEDYHEEVFGDLRLRPLDLIRDALFGRYPRIEDSRKETIKKCIREIPLDDIGSTFKESKHTKEFLSTQPGFKEALNFVEKYGIPSPIEIMPAPSSWNWIYKIYDGSHRRIIAEFLGIKTMPCLLYTKREIRIYTGII